MLPYLVAAYEPDRGPIDAVYLGDTLVCRVLDLSYFENIGVRQFGASVAGATRLPVFGDFIRHVVRVSPEEQVFGVNAGRIIATVTDPKT